MTILQQFINEGMNNYIPPANKRQGGLSAQKYKATLLFLTNMPQQDIAKKVGVSHGLLRKWRTEKVFLDTTGAHYKNFVLKCLFTLEHEKNIEAFADFENYNTILKSEVILSIINLAGTYPDTAFALATNLYEIVLKYLPKKEYPREIKMVGDILDLCTALSLKQKLTLVGDCDLKDRLLKDINFLIDSIKLRF